MELADKVAVVTGGASGIGLGTAVQMARAGADLVLADINELRLAEARERVEAQGRAALSVLCDVRDDAEVERLAARAIEWRGHVDVLMNNAGVALMGPPERIPIQDWMWILEVNLLGIVRGCKAFLPHMLDRGSGYIVNTASIAGQYAYSYDCLPYITSKFAAVGYTEGLAVYARPFGVGVSVLCPGLVETHLGENARFVGVDGPEGWTHFPEHMRRPLQPEEVGAMVVGAIADERYLILTHPEDAELLAERRHDLDAALERQVQNSPRPPRIR